MTKVKDYLVAFAAVAFIVQFVAFGHTGRAIAQTIQQVLVTNSNSNPVPVSVRGATTARISNPVTAPVWVRDVNEARQPVAAYVYVYLGVNDSYEGTTLYTVPAGKRLVIEYISGKGYVPFNQALVEAGVQTRISGIVGYHYVNPKSQGIYNNQTYYTLGEATQLYADAGAQVIAFATRSGWTDEGNILISFSGYLVDVP